MLKLSASFSKKVPADTAYSSQQYHASVELELADGLTPQELRQHIHDTFALVRDTVETELQAHGNGRPGPLAPVPVLAPPPKARAEPGASARQLAFLIDLATRQGLDVATLNAEAQERFGRPSLPGLTKRQASELIGCLSLPTPAAA